jgi:glucan phosphorylase
MEFLLGRSFKTNLCNLGLEKQYADALSEFGFNLHDLYEEEPDAGLGNGGLGRLAACFMDSLSSLDYPATGFSILYEYGLFKQKLVDGLQVELPDVWLPGGEVWLVPRTDRSFKVRFDGRVHEEWKDGRCEIIYDDAEEIEACANDMMISGANVLLFDEPTNHLDMESITALNNGLIKFPGVVLFACQDHQFVQTTANRIMEITADGKLIDKMTTYDEYLESEAGAKKRQKFVKTQEDN